MAWRRVVPSADPLSLSLTSSSAADTAAGSGGAAGFRPCRESKIPHLEEQARATKTRAATHPETARPLLIGAASGFAISGMIQRSQMSDEAGPGGSRFESLHGEEEAANLGLRGQVSCFIETTTACITGRP